MILPGENKTNRFGTIPKNELNDQIELFIPIEIWDFSGSKIYDLFSQDILPKNRKNRNLIPELRKKVIFQSLGIWLLIVFLKPIFSLAAFGAEVAFGINQIDLYYLLVGLIYSFSTFLILLVFLSFDKERKNFWRLFSLPRPFYSFILMFFMCFIYS